MFYTLPLAAVVLFAQTQTAVTAHLGYYDRVEQPRSTQFTIRIENVSNGATLKLSNGSSAPAPTAPLLWVVHTESDPIFTPGAPDHGNGLEPLAEDGNPSVLARWLQGRRSVVAAGAVNRPDGSSTPGPLTPGKAYEFRFTGQPGQRLTLAMMFAQSNDLFYAPESRGMLLFDATGRPMSGDITSQLILWDAGTEMNQEPGLGPDQGVRQKAPNTGSAEHGAVRPVRDRFKYPKASDVIRVTITPETATS